jgi:hypothetical protein
MTQRLSRRRFARFIVGAFGATAYSLFTRRDQALALENCYWKKMSGPTCNPSHQLVERWCYLLD